MRVRRAGSVGELPDYASKIIGRFISMTLNYKLPIAASGGKIGSCASPQADDKMDFDCLDRSRSTYR